MTKTRCDYDPATLTCRVCGHLARSLPTYRECKLPPPQEIRVSESSIFNDDLNIDKAIKLTKGLGDMTADALSAVGITKERVTYWIGRDCGCDARQEWLNQVGKIFGIGKQEVADVPRS